MPTESAMIFLIVEPSVYACVQQQSQPKKDGYIQKKSTDSDKDAQFFETCGGKLNIYQSMEECVIEIMLVAKKSTDISCPVDYKLIR